MSEPFLPVPDPEPDSNWDPTPARCGECNVILQNPHPASRGDGHWEGWCPYHGTVPAFYPSQVSEIDEEEDS